MAVNVRPLLSSSAPLIMSLPSFDFGYDYCPTILSTGMLLIVAAHLVPYNWFVGEFITVAFMSSDSIRHLFRQLSSLVPTIGNMQTQRVD